MNPQRQFKVNINEDIKKGRYANHVRITRAPSEVTLDFLYMHPETGGDYVARVVIAPEFLPNLAKLLSSPPSIPPNGKPDAVESKQIGFRANQTTDGLDDTLVS